MKNQSFILLLLALFLHSCIGDDIVIDTIDERLSIDTRLDSLQLDSSFQFSANFFNNIGEIEPATVNWSSSDENTISITPQGLATAHSLGIATIRASVQLEDNSLVEDEIDIVASENETVIVAPPAERNGEIRTTSSYVLRGSFTLSEDNGVLRLVFNDDYAASSSLPGLYVYLTNNPNTINNAFEIGKVPTFSGAHTYEISGPGLDEYSHLLYFCKPFGVKVGDGEIQ